MGQSTITIRCGQLWTPDGFAADRAVTLQDGKIVRVESGDSFPGTAGTDWIDARDGYVIPGLIDIQVNGALEHSFQAHHLAAFDQIVDYHVAGGTTTLVPTLVTAPDDVLLASLATLSAYLEQPRAVTLPGIHLEGPFLAPAKSGAHDPDALRLPDVDLAQRFLSAANGRIALFTLAPELPGALPVIAAMRRAGVVVCAGHSAATYTAMEHAMAAGLSFVTHLGNASDWPHRAMGDLGFLTSEPGLVGSFLALPTLGGSVILDGYHFHPALLGPLVQLKGEERVLLTSDASSVAGCSPGDYASGGLEVTVRPEGFALSGRGGGWLAGSIIRLSDAVARAVHLAGLPLHTAVTMATWGPAHLLGLENRKGQIAPGYDADLVILDEDLAVRQVVAAGEVVNDGG